MSNREQALRLLIIEQELELAEFLISHIRNGGIVVRPERATDAEQFQLLIEQNQVDMVLANPQDANLPLVQITDAIKKLGKDIPVLVTIDTISNDELLGVLKAGAQEIVLRDEAKHIQSVIRRQFQALNNRRAVRHFDAELRELERRCDGLIETSRDPIAYIHDGMHIRANESYLQMFGYENFDEIEGMPILDLIDGKQQAEFKQIIKEFSKTKQFPPSILATIRPENGESRQVEFELMSATFDDEICLQIVARPQLHDSQLSEQLRELKDRDPTTLLFNRKYFINQLESMISLAGTGTSNQSVLFINPDQFEQRVRSLGLDLTDKMLIEFSARLKALVGADGECCHYREQSLAVLCAQYSIEQTQNLAERIHRAFDNILLEIGEQTVSFSACISAIQITEQNANLPEILSTSARVLQSLEGLGGNRYEVVDPSAGDRAEAELNNAWKDRLVYAIANGEFALHYQPIIQLMQDEAVHSYELLIRLLSADGESISPDQFLPIAQTHQLIADIDQWVVKQAIQILAEQQQKNINTQIFVKISTDSLHDNSLINLISNALIASGVKGKNLILQLPESKIITRLKDVQAFKSAMQPLGVRLGLSQFGTSVDSLQMLSHFDADIIKIDRSFIEDLDKNTQNQVKVREFVQHARNHDKITIAEFVSDANTMSILFNAGVDCVQGNFLSPPLTHMNYDFSN